MGNATPPVKSLHPRFGVAEPPKRQPRRANWRLHKIIRSTRRPRAIVDFFLKHISMAQTPCKCAQRPRGPTFGLRIRRSQSIRCSSVSWTPSLPSLTSPPRPGNQDVSITLKDATGRAKTTAASRGATRRATSVQAPPAAFEPAPIFPSLPRKSRTILARCMIHSSTDNSRNNFASCASPYHHRNTGVAALAISAANDE